jgi:trehalose-6-phosphate synthase
MSLEERRDRWQSMVRKLKAASVQNWSSGFLHTLSDVQRAPVRTATAPIVLELARRRRSALTRHVRSSAISAMS